MPSPFSNVVRITISCRAVAVAGHLAGKILAPLHQNRLAGIVASFAGIYAGVQDKLK
jgi:hypothetical protein